eukprot:930018-Pleurochrysis_carterae.AAC.5
MEFAFPAKIWIWQCMRKMGYSKVVFDLSRLLHFCHQTPAQSSFARGRIGNGNGLATSSCGCSGNYRKLRSILLVRPSFDDLQQWFRGIGDEGGIVLTLDNTVVSQQLELPSRHSRPSL